MINDWTDEDFVEAVNEIDNCGEDLSEWEIEFISSLINGDWKHFTDKQKEQIVRIYEEKLY